MTVYELRQALDDLPSEMEVSAMVWPESNGQPIKHVSVMQVATINELAVLRLASSL